jgi:hypothetical protein
MELGERGKGRENDRASTISKYRTPVKVEDISLLLKNGGR